MYWRERVDITAVGRGPRRARATLPPSDVPGAPVGVGVAPGLRRGRRRDTVAGLARRRLRRRPVPGREPALRVPFRSEGGAADGPAAVAAAPPGRHDGVLAVGRGVGGPISQGGGITPAEAAAVLDDVASRGQMHAKITLRHDADEAWLSEARQYRIEKSGCYVLDLAGGFDEVWQKRFRVASDRTQS